MLPEFEVLLHRSFYARSIQSLDFGDNQAAARMINNWVEMMTKENIKDLINADMLNALTSMVLVSAIYFKGSWAKESVRKL